MRLQMKMFLAHVQWLEVSKKKKIIKSGKCGRSPSIVANGHFVSREWQLLSPQRDGGLKQPFSPALNSTGPPTVELHCSITVSVTERHRMELDTESLMLKQTVIQRNRVKTLNLTEYICLIPGQNISLNLIQDTINMT